MTLQAVTVPLDIGLDLNDVARGSGTLFVRDGVGFAGRGVAARVDVDTAVEFLAAIHHDDRVGGTPGPIALGSIPFLPGAEAQLIVPAVVVGKDADGRRWITSIGEPDIDVFDSAEPEPPRPPSHCILAWRSSSIWRPSPGPATRSGPEPSTRP